MSAIDRGSGSSMEEPERLKGPLADADGRENADHRANVPADSLEDTTTGSTASSESGAAPDTAQAGSAPSPTADPAAALPPLRAIRMPQPGRLPSRVVPRLRRIPHTAPHLLRRGPPLPAPRGALPCPARPPPCTGLGRFPDRRRSGRLRSTPRHGLQAVPRPGPTRVHGRTGRLSSRANRISRAAAGRHRRPLAASSRPPADSRR